MEKDLYRGRRSDDRKGPYGQDKTSKAVTVKKAAGDALKTLTKAFSEDALGGGVPTNSMSSGAVADPKNKRLFGKTFKRFKTFVKDK